MTRLFCTNCHNYIYLMPEEIENFSGCKCGATLTKDSLNLCLELENRRDELNKVVKRHNDEEIGSIFYFDFI